MVDPPPFAYYLLKKHAVPSSLIESVIISHCHADHDAGAFQKILESQKIEVDFFIQLEYIYLFLVYYYKDYHGVFCQKIFSFNCNG